MMSREMFNAADLAALDAIASACEAAGLHVGRDDTNQCNASALHVMVCARIYPRREGEGVMVTGIAHGQRRYFDGPAAAFAEPRQSELEKLRAWLAQHAPR